MGNILLIDDRPIMAVNLAKEWALYYEKMWPNKIRPIFHVATIYDKDAVPPDVTRVQDLVNKKLSEINKIERKDYFEIINLQETEYTKRINELESKVNAIIDKIAGTSSFLMALDLHLFQSDSTKVQRGETISSMFVYKKAIDMGKRVMLYTSFWDENQLASYWKTAYETNWGQLNAFIYARESALNYDVMVSSAKQLLNEVVDQ